MSLTHDIIHDVEARGRLLQEYKSNLGILALVDAVATQAQLLEDSNWTLQNQRWLVNAKGVQLDGLGQMVGLSRNGMDDTTYATWLAAQILANTAGGDGGRILTIASMLIAGTWQMVEQWPGAFVLWAPASLVRAAVVAEILSNATACGVNGQMVYTPNPANVTFTFSSNDAEGGASSTTTTYATHGTFNITIPSGAANLRVQLWGAGGAARVNASSGSGGGGGAYAESTFASPTPGAYTLVVGAGGASTGGSSSWNTSDIIAVGGTIGGSHFGGAGGAAASCTGTIKYSGGNGGTQSGSVPITSGGGGASATSVGNGISAIGLAGGAAAADGGPGANGFAYPPDVNGIAPSSGPGGGGSGGVGTGASSPGYGYDGQAIITYSIPNPQGWGSDDQSTGGLWADVEQL